MMQQAVTLLDSFGLHEYVRQPTRGSRQLDVFISHADQPDPVVRVDPPLLSGHSHDSLVVAPFDAAREQSVHPTSVSRRCWRSFDFDSFITNLKQSQLVLDPPTNVTELFHQYDTTLATLLDKHAPWRQPQLQGTTRGTMVRC